MSCPATIARILHKEGIEKAQSTMKKAHEEYAGVTLNLHAFYNDDERGFYMFPRVCLMCEPASHASHASHSASHASHNASHASHAS